MAGLGDLFRGIGGLGSNIAILAGAAGDDGQRYRQRAYDVFSGIPMPQFDTTSIAPPVYTDAAQREAVTFSPENRDAQLRTIKEDPEVRARQLQNLAVLGQIRDTGLSEMDRLAAQDIQRDISSAHTRAVQSSLADLAARGRLGGGEEAVMRAAQAQQAAELARGSSADLTQQALARRFAGTQAYGDAAQNLRLQDLAAEQSKTDTTNRWNQYMMSLLTNSRAQNAMAQERAQAANVGRRQSVADANAGARYENAYRNQSRDNTLAQQGFGNQMARAGGQASALGALGQGQDARQTARAQTIRNMGEGFGQAVGGGFEAFGGFGGGKMAPAAPGQGGYGAPTSVQNRYPEMMYRPWA